MTLPLLVIPLLMEASSLFAYFAAAAHCSLILSLLCTRTPRSLLTQLLPSQVDPSLRYTPGLCSLRCKTLHLSLLNFIKFLLTHSSSLSMSSCRVAVPSEVFISSLSLISLANFVMVHLISSSRWLMKIFDSIGPYIDCCGTPLVTGYHHSLGVTSQPVPHAPHKPLV